MSEILVFFKTVYTPGYVINADKWGKRKCSKENGTGYQVLHEMVRSVHDVARYTQMHIMYKQL
jgi:hypothetical protein